MANRQRGEIEGLIGFFVNTLVMRCDLADESSVVELLEQVKEVTLEGVCPSGHAVRAAGGGAEAAAQLESQSGVPSDVDVCRTRRGQRVELPGLRLSARRLRTRARRSSI